MKKKRKKSCLRVVVLPLILIIGAVLTMEAAERRQAWLDLAREYSEMAETEKEWIRSCQTEDGLILFTSWGDKGHWEEQTSIPYFSNIAAWGLLSGEPSQEDLQAARRYFLWYVDHLNTAETDPINGDGTIYDYQVTRGRDGTLEVSRTNHCDSVDAYAATFLIFAQAYLHQGGEEVLVQRQQDLWRVTEAMLRMLRPETGLTQARLDYPVQYLMDNAEVCRGLWAAQELLETLDPESPLLHRVTAASAGLEQAIEQRLWDPNTRTYCMGLTDGGTPQESHVDSEFYPDAAAQVFPIIYDILDPLNTRSAELYTRFRDDWNIAELSYRNGDRKSFYWNLTGYAAAKMRDEATVYTYMETYLHLLDREGRDYPLYTGDAGWAAMLCTEMESFYRGRFW